MVVLEAVIKKQCVFILKLCTIVWFYVVLRIVK